MKIKSDIPPYISTPKLQAILTLLTTRNFSTLELSDLRNRGFSQSDASLTLSALRFLNLIDESSKISAEARRLQLKGGERETALSEITRNAYKKLFETIPEANNMSKDELYNEFVSIYGLSRRLASPAILAFIYLCAASGIPTSENVVPKSRNSENTIKNKVSAKTNQTEKHQLLPRIRLSNQNTNSLFSKDFDGLTITITSDHWMKKLMDGELKNTFDLIETLRPNEGESEPGSELVGEAD